MLLSTSQNSVENEEHENNGSQNSLEHREANRGELSDLLKYRTIFDAEELNGKRRNKGSFDLRKRGRLLNVMARDWAEKQKVDSRGTRECIE